MQQVAGKIDAVLHMNAWNRVPHLTTLDVRSATFTAPVRIVRQAIHDHLDVVIVQIIKQRSRR